jgi:integrase/recombinase XerD
VYAYTGLRPKELRLAQIEDLDTVKWTIWVRHPKGEGKYGKQRTVPIPPQIRPHIQKYLLARAEQLKKYQIGYCEQLIPNFTKEGTSYFSDGGFRKLKYPLEKEAGIRFKLKDFRSSYAQNLKDRGISIEVVSKALGHTSTKTTERFYARIRDASVFEEINRAWERPKNNFHDDKPNGTKKPQMKNENYLYGYA